MRNTIRTTIALMMMIGGLSFTAQAQDDGVDHCKFARELCIRLGIPTSTTASGDELFALLIKEGIYPKEGWECDKVLTVGDFARVITQVLENKSKTTLVENREDDQAFIDYLKGEGYSLDSIDDTLGTIGTLADQSNQAAEVAQNTTDPSDKPRDRPGTQQVTRTSPPESVSSTAIAAALKHLLEVQQKEPGHPPVP